jgi:phosphate ABC transporter phosphate-binding protein
MPPPATTPELFDLISRSGLLPPPLADSHLARHRAADPQMTLRHLVSDGVVTSFQARFLATGRYKGFFLGGKYKLLEHLGSGGMGEVYLGEQLLLRRLVAIKLLRASKSAGDSTGATHRFLREARAAAGLTHPNIAQLYDVDQSGPNPYMVMEYVDGTNLHAVVADGGPLAVPRAVGYTVQAACGLEHAHLRGLVHRDVKPGNLMLDRSGAVKVLDLGLARYHSDATKNDNLTARYDDNNLIGTADFIAPEQTQDSSAVDARADIYSLGCTLYFFLAGRAPFEDGTIAQKLLWQQLKQPEPVRLVRPDVPPELAAVLDRMMTKDREQRYQTADDVCRALALWVNPNLPPPAAGEMPARRAEQYRLGLVDTAPQFDALSQAIPATPLKPAGGDTTDPPRSGSTIHVAAPLYSLPPLPPGTSIHPPRPLRRWLMFGAVQLLLLALTVVVTTYLNNYARQGLNTPPVRPPNAAVTPVPFRAGGSTLIQPLMREWTTDYQKQTGATFEYDPVGSGKGIDGLRAGEYDLAFTDVFLTDAELAEAAASGRRLIHVPVVTGAVVPVYHLPGYDDPLVLTGEVLADIYAGRVRRWDDPKLVALNRQLANYAGVADITVVYRADASGTSATFTEFLSKATGGRGWAAAAKTFPDGQIGLPVNKHDEMAQAVKGKPGAIGYVEYATVLAGGFQYGPVRNPNGVYVLPSLAGVTAAAEGLALPDDLRYTAVFVGGKLAYPIAAATWAVFDANAPADKLVAVAVFLDWATRPDTDHNRGLESLGYVRLPEKVAAAARAKLKRLRQ